MLEGGWVQAAWQGGLGLVVGSFLALASVRLPAGEPIVLARSRCRSCAKALGPHELVPVLSWMIQRGRCRTCAAPIGWRYPVMELSCAGLAAWAALATPGLPGALGALFAWQLLLIAAIDAEHYWLPDRLTLPLAITGLLAAALFEAHQALDRVVGAAAGFLALAGLAWGYRRLRGREGLGGGDPRLLAGIGAWVGWQGLPLTLLLASLAGLSLVLAARLWGRPMAGDDRLPFGAFLALGAWLSWLHATG
ncbi:prepilin peptidase [Brevundimonas sp. 2R-24]|uniref:Prepilin leader peptidase/N-methyltransferase n=1 Tax=Peiella sedimenti TaxID=3061083 RepID=A0ABT8SJD0_9CAUL|nr:prepilin peptidase [Caulobacteraceae bacterium XZ-24]